MNDKRIFAMFLHELAEMLGFDSLHGDEKDHCVLEVDESLFVHIRHLPEKGEFAFIIPLGSVRSDDLELLTLMLEANTLGRGTAGGNLGVEKNGGQWVVGLSARYPLRTINATVAVEYLQGLIDIAEKWQGYLEKRRPEIKQIHIGKDSFVGLSMLRA